MNLNNRYSFPDNYHKFSKALKTALTIKYNEPNSFYKSLKQLKITKEHTTLTREAIESRGYVGEYKKEHLHTLLYAYMKEKKQEFSIQEYKILHELLLGAASKSDRDGQDKQATVFWTRYQVVNQLLIDYEFNSIRIEEESQSIINVEYGNCLIEIIPSFIVRPIIMDDLTIPSLSSFYNSFETYLSDSCRFETLLQPDIIMDDFKIPLQYSLYNSYETFLEFNYQSTLVSQYIPIVTIEFLTQDWSIDKEVSSVECPMDASLSSVQSCVNHSTINTINDNQTQDSTHERVVSSFLSDTSLFPVESCVGSSESTRTSSNNRFKEYLIHRESCRHSGGRRRYTTTDTSWSMQTLVLYVLLFAIINISLLMLVLWTRFRLYL